MLEQQPAHPGPPPQRDALLSLSAPTQAWSRLDGSMAGEGLSGVFHGGWRFVRSIALLVDGEPVELSPSSSETDWALFRGSAPGRAAEGGGVVLERMREVGPGTLVERATLANDSEAPIEALMELAVEVAFAPLEAVRAGRPAGVAVRARVDGDEAVVTDGIRTLRVQGRGGRVRLERD
ncbi:glycogen debranching N-terminal domain-containing protein, partial [Agrococcus sp. HG114]|uniref:glycogen debranching N-terminal domain-containing protein n=1 Tax=Agrococcus sp. HG114 TaxID=2969757 RepID=UPI002810CCB6